MPWHNLLPSASHAKHFPEHLPSVSLKQRAPLIRAPSGVEIYRKTNVANVARRRRRLTESRHNRPLYILPPCLIFSHFYNALKGAANTMCVTLHGLKCWTVPHWRVLLHNILHSCAFCTARHCLYFVSARYIQPVPLMGRAAFCFSAGSGAFIMAGNLCKEFDVSYK